MGRPRRAVIRAAVAQNRPTRPRLSTGVGQTHRATANTGVSRGTPARPSNAQRGVGRGTGGAGAPSPSTGLPQASAAMPWDSAATTTSASGQRSYSDKMAGIASERDFKERYYGLAPGYQNNPYSQASLLQRQREIGTRGINQRPGQLYSGATINHLGQVERGYNEGYYNLGQAQAADEAKWEREELETQHEKETADEEAQQRAIERAEESAPEPAAVAESSAPGGGGGGSRKVKKGGGKGGGGGGPAVGKGRKAR